MKNGIVLLAFLIISTCSSKEKKHLTPVLIARDQVDHIYLDDTTAQTDAVRLSSDHTALIIDKLNTALPAETREISPRFWLSIKLKNNSSRLFSVSEDLVKEKNGSTYLISDSTLVPWLWDMNNDSFLVPERYNPVSFIDKVSISTPLNIKVDDHYGGPSYYLGQSFLGEFPEDWIKEKHLADLYALLDNQDTCVCYINTYSSHIPHDFAQKGGFARVFLEFYTQKKPVYFGLYACPKVDEQKNRKFKRWWWAGH